MHALPGYLPYILIVLLFDQIEIYFLSDSLAHYSPHLLKQ